jgi:hypothetical protein
MSEELLHQEQWEQGWEAHELAQLRRLARLSLIEKLDWLEQAHRLVRHLQAARTGESHKAEGDPETAR